MVSKYMYTYVHTDMNNMLRTYLQVKASRELNLMRALDEDTRVMSGPVEQKKKEKTLVSSFQALTRFSSI